MCGLSIWTYYMHRDSSIGYLGWEARSKICWRDWLHDLDLRVVMDKGVHIVWILRTCLQDRRWIGLNLLSTDIVLYSLQFLFESTVHCLRHGLWFEQMVLCIRMLATCSRFGIVVGVFWHPLYIPGCLFLAIPLHSFQVWESTFGIEPCSTFDQGFAENRMEVIAISTGRRPSYTL